MPIPQPDKNEEKDKYISRCIKFVIDEGKPQKQAIAICYSVWDKSLGGEGKMTIMDRIDRYLNEAKNTVKAGIKKKINTEIQKYLKPTYFKKIPLQPLFDILEKYDIVPLQEDNTYWDGFLLGGVKKTERVNFNLGVKSLKDDNNRYPIIINADLILTYYKMESGKYEIIAYMG